MKRIVKLFLLVAIVGVLAGCTVCPPCPPCETPTPGATATPAAVTLWDPVLSSLNVSVQRNGRYELIAAWVTHYGSWDGVPTWAKQWQLDTLGGDTHAFGRCLDVDGGVLGDKTFALSWPDGAAGFTPEPDGWANAFLGGGGSLYFPDQGQSGPFTWGPLNSDKLTGLGLPYNQHYSFFGVWRARW